MARRDGGRRHLRPVSNTIRAHRADKVAAWFVDSDYDGRTFCITQAFFPDKQAWEKLSKALKGVVDEEASRPCRARSAFRFRAASTSASP